VEVVSPNDPYTGVEEKVNGWLRARTRMVVAVNPQRRMVTVRLSQTAIKVLCEGDILDGGNVVPGWRLPVADILR
jgi:Uma2 family endonuclease